MSDPMMCKGSEGPASGLPIGVLALGGTQSTPSRAIVNCRLRGRPPSLFSPFAGTTRAIGVFDRLTGGVGGTSPMIRTKVSTVSQSIFMAASGEILNTSMSAALERAPGSSNGEDTSWVTPESAEGFGGGGSGGASVSATVAPELSGLDFLSLVLFILQSGSIYALSFAGQGRA